MFEWLLWLLSLLAGPAVPVPQDYIPAVAAEAAYSAMRPADVVVKPKPDTKDCKTCNATGRVRTGDGQGWTKCPDCESRGGMLPTDAPKSKLTVPSPAGWPARTVPSVAN